jgi:hypothetical protein
MGAETYIYAEVRRYGSWQPYPDLIPVRVDKVKDEFHPVEFVDGGPRRELHAVLMGYKPHKPHKGFHFETGGLHCYEEVKPIAELRGFPKDMNQFYQDYFLPRYNSNTYDGSPSWLMAREILEFDWDGQFLNHKARVKQQYTHLFKSGSTFPKRFPKKQSLYSCYPLSRRLEPDTEEVSWKKSYRDFVDDAYFYPWNKKFRFVEWLLEKLREIGPPDDARMIFWDEI